MKTLLLAGAFGLLSSATSFAANLQCVSYSKAYDLAISVSDTRATIQVLRADQQRNAYSLTNGEAIVLARAAEHHPDWARFEGQSKRKQNITFSGKKTDLSSFGELRTNLSISEDWTDTTSVMLQLDCVSK